MAQSVDNDSVSVRGRHACCCQKRLWKRRHLAVVTVALALHYAPLSRMFNHWRGIRDEEIFPSKNIRGRILANGAYVCQGDRGSPISPAQFGVNNFHRIRIPIQGELACHQGYFLAQPNSQEAATLVYFQNTNENLGQLLETLCDVYHNLKVNVVCADMRGLGTCAGVPTSESMAEDARRITKYVATSLNNEAKDDLPRIDPRKIFVFGHNLACHAALDVASHPEARDYIQGAIVSNPLPSILDSLPAKEKLAPSYWVQGYYPDRFDNVPLIQNCNQKLLAIGTPHGLEPSIDKLNSLIKEAKYSPARVVLVGGIGSENSLSKLNDMPPSFAKAITSFFKDGSKRSTHASYFESRNFDFNQSEDGLTDHNAKHDSQVCRKIRDGIEDKIRGWVDYLHGKIRNETAEEIVVNTVNTQGEIVNDNDSSLSTPLHSEKEATSLSPASSQENKLTTPDANVELSFCLECAPKKTDPFGAALGKEAAAEADQIPSSLGTSFEQINRSSEQNTNEPSKNEAAFISEIREAFDSRSS